MLVYSYINENRLQTILVAQIKEKTMEFEINGMKWQVFKKSSIEIINSYKDQMNEEINYLFGYTDFVKHEIWINKETCFDQQCTTLAHELTHCWLFNSGMYYVENFKSETLCEIVANSYRFINDIVERYKKDMRE